MERQGIALGLAVALHSVALAHPMGNFSVSHYARFSPADNRPVVTYALDLAEIPSFEFVRERQLPREAGKDEIAQAAQAAMADWMAQLEPRLNGQAVLLRPETVSATVTDGAGGVPVILLTARATVPLPAGPVRVEYHDRNFEGRAGWKEIVVDSAPGWQATASQPHRSHVLTAYPADPAAALPQEVAVTFQLRARRDSAVARSTLPAGPHPATPSPAPDELRSDRIGPQHRPETAILPPVSQARPASGAALERSGLLSRLLQRPELPWNLALLGLGVAFVLGAIHALSPGHGKTLVAAYLVGARGTLHHAAFLGAVVTFTHTVSVFLLGLATLFLSQFVLPEKIMPCLGAISGLSIIVLGLSLLRRRVATLRGRPGAVASHSHHQGLWHTHSLEGGHDPGDGQPHHPLPEEISLPALVALGVSGGLVPCPTALVLLLSAIALGRTAYGLALLASFSLGLALVLTAVGAMVLYAKSLLPKAPAIASSRWVQVAPVASALVIVGVGILMTGSSIGLF